MLVMSAFHFAPGLQDSRLVNSAIVLLELFVFKTDRIDASRCDFAAMGGELNRRTTKQLS